MSMASSVKSASITRVEAVRFRSGWSWRTFLVTAFAAVLVLGVVVGRFVWPPLPATSWFGRLLGGPEFAMNPRISPDGHTLAFLTFVDELTQVAVMQPDTGNWTVLTRSSARGYVQELSWSRDGARIYYDRRTEVSQGVFSIPAAGGDEHLVLQDAEGPQALPDGSLLLFRWNARRRQQLFRYWPDTGSVHPFPVEILKSDAHPIPIRVSQDGRSAVVVGRPILPTPYLSSSVLVLVDLVTGGIRVLDNAAVPPFSLAIARDRKSVLAATMSGDSSTIELLALGGGRRTRTLLSATHPMHLDVGPDGALYADEVDRPDTLVRFSAAGGAIRKIGCNVADIATPTLSRRIPFDKGSISSWAATPDGKTLFIAAGGNVWSIPADGGEPRIIRAGDSVGVDPSGKFLLVQVIEFPQTRLIRVPLDGGAEQEIRLIGQYHLSSTPINSRMIKEDGRLVVSLVSPDSWFVSPGIVDLATGLATRIPVDRHYDYVSTAWAPDGSIQATARGLKSSLWRFQEASR
jgi:WD40-like Beta Propeller Repeat